MFSHLGSPKFIILLLGYRRIFSDLENVHILLYEKSRLWQSVKDKSNVYLDMYA